MNTFFSTNLYTTAMRALIIVIVCGAVGFAAATTYAVPVPPISGPTATPANPPYENFYEPLTLDGVKEGKFGVGSAAADPGTDYDFRVNGPSYFYSGLWATSAVFGENVYLCPFFQSGDPTCAAGSTTARVYGQVIFTRPAGPNIQNDLLVNADGNARVCSDSGGNLRLCPEDDSTGASINQGGNGAAVNNQTGNPGTAQEQNPGSEGAGNDGGNG